MRAWAGLTAAALLAAAITWWWYGRREERVRGRWPAALLRASALFLLVASPWLPARTDRDAGSPSTGILLDRSVSMRLPVGGEAGRTRAEEAREVVGDLVRSHRDAAVWGFADGVVRIDRDSLSALDAEGHASRIVEAIEGARAAGADSLFLVTDGELEDREAGRRLAEQLGVGLTEVQVADPVRRTAVQSISIPRWVTAGDTFEVRARLVATEGGADSTRLVAELDGRTAAVERVPTPGPGRTTEAVFRLAAEARTDSLAWVPLEVRVEDVGEPWDSAARLRAWIGVTSVARGAVLVSTSPDWEGRYLVPLLDRSVPGGARGFARLGPGSWIGTGSGNPALVEESAVRRAAEAATLLVIQGSPAELPDWLDQAARGTKSLLFLVRGSGPVPGTPVSASDPQPGEWFAVTPPPPGPVGASLLGVESGALPPLTRLFGSAAGRFPVALEARLDRLDSPRPAVGLGTDGARRWAVVLGEGTWRWATRRGEGMALYRGLYEGIGRWLTEREVSWPVELLDPAPRAGDSLLWRVAPGVRDLSLRLEEPGGNVLWSESVLEPAGTLAGPPLRTGEARLVVTGSVSGDPFRLERPLHGNASREFVPRTTSPGLRSEPERPVERGGDRPDRPPVWPFAVAVGLLSAEWLWRRRVGLK